MRYNDFAQARILSGSKFIKCFSATLNIKEYKHVRREEKCLRHKELTSFLVLYSQRDRNILTGNINGGGVNKVNILVFENTFSM